MENSEELTEQKVLKVNKLVIKDAEKRQSLIIYEENYSEYKSFDLLIDSIILKNKKALQDNQ